MLEQAREIRECPDIADILIKLRSCQAFHILSEFSFLWLMALVPVEIPIAGELFGEKSRDVITVFPAEETLISIISCIGGRPGDAQIQPHQAEHNIVENCIIAD